MAKVIGVYKIIFDNGAKQIKNLISHDDYLNIYKKYQDEIYELEKKNKFKETSTTKQLKKDLIDFFGIEWFTDKSPYFDAINTGNIKVDGYKQMFGPKLIDYPIYYNCKVEKI